MVGGGRHDPFQDAAFGLFRLGLYRRRLGSGGHILPKLGQGGLQFGTGELAQILEGIKLQPQQQGLGRGRVGNGLLLGIEGLPEVVEISGKGLFLLERPGFAGLLAQMGQELGVIAGTAELHVIKAGGLVELQKFVVGDDLGVGAYRGNHPDDHAGDPGSAEVPQDTDPLVAFLDIEFS